MESKPKSNVLIFEIWYKVVQMWKIYLVGVVLALGTAEGKATLDYHNYSVTEDYIANAIRPPHPPSVSDILEDINETPNLTAIESLNLRNNQVALPGATKILEFIPNHLPNLKTLDLSYNKISDRREDENYPAFLKNLRTLLQRSTFEVIKLEGNPIAELIPRLNWIQYLMLSGFGEEEISKICF